MKLSEALDKLETAIEECVKSTAELERRVELIVERLDQNIALVVAVEKLIHGDLDQPSPLPRLLGRVERVEQRFDWLVEGGVTQTTINAEIRKLRSDVDSLKKKQETNVAPTHMDDMRRAFEWPDAAGSEQAQTIHGWDPPTREEYDCSFEEEVL